MDSVTRKVWFPSRRITVRKTMQLIGAIEAFVKPREGERNRFLFRGAANKQYGLMPSLPRARQEYPWLTEGMLSHIEGQAIQQFSSKAHLYIDKKFLPAGTATVEDRLRWMAIMQHYGVKTRLLDWTVSPYVAAFFAVVHQPNADGVIWMVETGAHYQRMAEQFPDQFHGDSRSLPLLSVPFGFFEDAREERKWRRHAKREATRLEHSLMFFPCTEANERMLSQRGWFSCPSVLTIDHEKAIATAFAAIPERRFAQKIFIDKAAKSTILRDLWHMNITGETMFPGLDGLGRAMSELVALLTPSSKDIFHLEQGVLTRTEKTHKRST